MPTETECKIPVQDFAPIEARLQALHAAPHGRFLQDDRFFDSADHRLLQADEGLRLRSLQPQDSPDSSPQHILTYKGPRQKAQLKQREEIETAITDPQALTDILDRLGLTLMLRLQKHRTRYRLDDCWIELDTLPLLGRFVEVEGPNHDAIAQVAAQLNLDLSHSLTDSYASLLMAQARQRNLPTAPAIFLLPDKP